MTDNEIIKALEDLLKNFDGKVIDFMAISYAIDLINRQKAEIERLNKANEKIISESGHQSELWARHFESIFETAKETAKAEAINELAHRAENRIATNTDISNAQYQSIIFEISEACKEMVGDAE